MKTTRNRGGKQSVLLALIVIGAGVYHQHASGAGLFRKDGPVETASTTVRQWWQSVERQVTPKLAVEPQPQQRPTGYMHFRPDYGPDAPAWRWEEVPCEPRGGYVEYGPDGYDGPRGHCRGW